jgi:hypothetical protein
MKKTFPLSAEFIYQLFALVVIIIVVHAVYVGLIRPRADAILAEQAALRPSGSGRCCIWI